LEIARPKKTADGVRSAAAVGIDKETIRLAWLASAPAAWTLQSHRIFPQA
jgi:hypothetical protein